MDLSTTYCGLQLAHPLIPGASPMVDDIDTVRQLEDAGAAAIVMHSLFEEQVVGEQLASLHASAGHADASPEATSYFPQPDAFALGPDEYLEQLALIKQSVDVPVIGSLNGTTIGGWLDYAQLMEEAGADALELNVYAIATDPAVNAEALESTTVEMLQTVKRAVNIPTAVKLSPFYTSLPHFGKRLDDAGADGLVLFNRFYQPDIDVEKLEVIHALRLSDSSELLMRLRNLAILSPAVKGSLAVTGGVHTSIDAVKALMSGAHAVQMVSALLMHGPGYLTKIRGELEAWLEEYEYDSVRQMIGSMNLSRCPDPKAYERGNYMHVIQSWWGE